MEKSDVPVWRELVAEHLEKIDLTQAGGEPSWLEFYDYNMNVLYCICIYIYTCNIYI